MVRNSSIATSKATNAGINERPDFKIPRAEYAAKTNVKGMSLGAAELPRKRQRNPGRATFQEQLAGSRLSRASTTMMKAVARVSGRRPMSKKAAVTAKGTVHSSHRGVACFRNRAIVAAEMPMQDAI